MRKYLKITVDLRFEPYRKSVSDEGELRMASPFDLQQTAETIRANIEARFASFSSEEQMEKNRKAYAAEKSRRYKLSLIRKWRNAK